MGIRFTPKFSVNDIRKVIDQRIAVIENATLDQLKQVGEQFVRDARSTRTYKDRTRNLRGSIGYIILQDGKQIFGNFQEPNALPPNVRKRKKKEGEPEVTEQAFVGDEVGKKLAFTIGDEYPVGYVLIVVAGMHYAGYVEAKGYDVLTGSSLTAETNLKKAISKLQDRIKKMK